MNRRDAIKNLSLTFGVTIATPTLLSILNACSNNEQEWVPDYLNRTQEYMIRHLVDIMLPKSETPGGVELNIVQFIDKMIAHTMTKKDQQLFNQGYLEFDNTFHNIYKKVSLKGTKEDYKTLLEMYFNISEEKQQLIFKQLESNVLDLEKKPKLFIYKFLTTIRYYSLLGFYTSQEIMEGQLNYNANMGYYESCVDL
ncbi:gluconate 2-dehydrogenase subunit 3 family protein [Flavivirga spongiicola]|uniref:Gluconate 2-dehydrogenase subunit 3 family protein n=1 Tax=Flavivirga spongiicola TaxID=421621 RepID=A0ABU7XZF2_9FLAO|nr:gluconate 2-dehydrogenase subunit 3 family protein [Flavivirga sp. MEBiC05379]MDO5980224.1 gluconate 2-dehydrogenase subunit 3 family protein [Flavivirga sp. MEBiC05379]